MRGWDLATALLLAALLAVALATFRDYGGTYDEDHQQRIGQNVLAWYESSFRDRAALEPGVTGNYFIYGGLFDAMAELAAEVSPLDDVETRHLVGALWSLAGIAGAALLARRLAGARAGFFAALLLATTPVWWGHGFANPKDIPFGAPYPWIALTLLHAADRLPRPPARRLVAAGVALGAALGVRPGGIAVLLPLAAGIWGVRLRPALAGRSGREAIRVIGAAAGALAVVVGVAWVVMLSAWPWGQLNPLRGPLLAASQAGQFATGIVVRFAGRWYWSFDLPRSYALTWFGLTLPEAWLLCGIAGVAVALRRRGATSRWGADHALVAAAGLLPVAAAVVLHPNIYDGIRHLLFVVPALASLAAAAMSDALERLPRWPSLALVAAGAVSTAVTVADMIALHPYQYVYFNRTFAGGVASAGEAYELDYWGMSYREGMEWLARNFRFEPERTVNVVTYAPAFLASHWIAEDPVAERRFVVHGSAASVAEAGGNDVALATTRWFHHRVPGRVLHVVERLGAPLLYVIRLDPPGERYERFEGGDAAIEMALPPGWIVTPAAEPGGMGSTYELHADDGSGRHILMRLATPETAPVGSVEALRDQLLSWAARRWRSSPEALVAMPLAGPDARGWFVSAGGRGPASGMTVALVAQRVGPAAVFCEVSTFDAAGDAMRGVLDVLATARPAGPEGRREP